MELKYTITEVKHEELPIVKEINEVTLPENYPMYFYEMLYMNFPKAFLVAKVDGKIVGYIMCRVETAFKFDTLIPKVYKSGHIISIAVLKEYRRMGIGESLMKKAMESLKNHYNCSEVYLEVRVSNMPAIKLYEKLNFKIDRIIRGYYRDGEDAYVMSRSLDRLEWAEQ